MSSSSSEEDSVVRTCAGVRLLTMEEANDMAFRFRQQYGMDKPCPSRPNTKGRTQKPASSSRASGKQHPLGKKPNEEKPEEDPKSTKLPFDKKRSIPKALSKKAMEHKQGPEKFYFRDIEVKTLSHNFATAALSYLRKKGNNLELVEACLYEMGEITRGFRVHFNFKAKRADELSAPVETYFGQLRHYGDTNIVVECSVSLGESESLPNKRDNRGCHYCTKYVHHPVGGCKGMKWGLLRWSKSKERFYFI